jgi:hypothetical protein
MVPKGELDILWRAEAVCNAHASDSDIPPLWQGHLKSVSTRLGNICLSEIIRQGMGTNSMACKGKKGKGGKGK